MRLAFLALICLSGLVWGGGMLLLFPDNNPALQVFLIVVVLGMGAGATASFGAYFPALAVYLIPLTIPISMILLSMGLSNHGAAFGAFGLIFLVVLLVLGLARHRNFASSVRLDFENAYLALDLENVQRRLEDAIEIRVSDNGPGIPQQVREKVFEPFFTTKPTGSGTGLGLSMSYDIVTKGHGGTMEMESVEGKGAVFVVRLPV